MTRDTISLESFNAVGAGQRATLNVPVTSIYHAITIEYKRNGALATQAEMEADIEQIDIEVNGVVQRTMTPTQLFKINAVRGRNVTTGYLPIYFSEPWSRSGQGEDGKAWGTQDIETFTVVVKLASGATSPALRATAEIELGNRPIGLIEKWRRYTVPVSAIGLVSWNPPIQPLDSYYTLQCFSGDINSYKVQVDSRIRKEDSLSSLNARLVDKMLHPQAETTHIMFNETNRAGDSLPMVTNNGAVRNFRVDFRVDAANSFEVITQTLGRPD